MGGAPGGGRRGEAAARGGAREPASWPAAGKCARKKGGEKVLGEAAAIANLVGIAPEEDRDVVADAVAKAFARKAVAPLSAYRLRCRARYG